MNEIETVGVKECGITGIKVSPATDVKHLTKTIPYAPGMPLRHEISTLASSTDSVLQKQWTLFVLGLEGFKNKPVEDRLSFFQVAGIHGYPETPWDSSAAPKQDPQIPQGQTDLPAGWQPFGGYCHHNTIGFGTWHRPYMLLYEQCIWLNMADVIADWKLTGQDLKDWTFAKDTWRLPYWDWARVATYKSYQLPEVCTDDKVKIYPPSNINIPSQYPNPLTGFVNPEKENGKPRAFGNMPPGKEQWNIKDDITDPKQTMPWSKCSGISRYGITSTDKGKTWTGLEGVNNYEAANKVMADFFWYSHAKDLSNLSDAVNRMLTPEYCTWGTFVSTKWNAEGEEKTVQTGYLSLEFIHNNVHNNVGGTGDGGKGDRGNSDGGTKYTEMGHMSDVPVAAFDPIFWMHHCNIDRLVAMWQALYWDKWWDTAESTTAEDPKKNILNVRDIVPDEPLTPFHTRDDGSPSDDYWTSNQARDWTTLYYQYDDLVPSSDAILADGTLDEQKYQIELQQYVQKTYPNSSQVVHGIVMDSAISNENFIGADDGTWTDYIINIVYDRYALNGQSYAVRFYLGGNPNDPDSTFSYPENFIGKVYNFAGLPAAPSNTPNGGCANCSSQKEAKVLSKAQVPITNQLVRQALDDGYTHIGSILEDEVTDYLTSHLHWKFVAMGGEERPASDFPDTKISVWSGTGSPRPIDQNPVALPPKYEDYAPLHAVTEHKHGGLKRNDPVLGEHYHHRHHRPGRSSRA